MPFERRHNEKDNKSFALGNGKTARIYGACEDGSDNEIRAVEAAGFCPHIRLSGQRFRR